MKIKVWENKKYWSIEFKDKNREIIHKRSENDRAYYIKFGPDSEPNGRKYSAYKAWVLNKPTKRIPLIVDSILDTQINYGEGPVKRLIAGVKQFMKAVDASKQ
jgi:hypothetical protein